MEGLSSLDIDNILSKHRATAYIYNGVFASDELRAPISTVEPYCLISNIDERWQPGSHWIAIYVTETQIEYFDPYGLYPFIPNIAKFLKNESKRRGVPIRTNSTKIQGMRSSACGHFCMTYCISRACDNSISHYLNMFHHEEKNLHKNDAIVRAIMRLRRLSIRDNSVQQCRPLCSIYP
jgi:hypothetical protein